MKPLRIILGLVLILPTSCADESLPSPVTLDFSEIESPCAPGSSTPNLTTSPDGTFLLTWIEQTENEAEERTISRLKLAALGHENRWEVRSTIAVGDDWFVNWADFPSLRALTSKAFVTHWLEKSGPGTFSYDVKLTISRDGGLTWSDPMIPHRDETPTEHGFVSIVPLDEERFFASWLDGRDTQEDSPVTRMALRGAIIDVTGAIQEERLLDEKVCDCCQTAATLTEHGVLIAYRDRSPDEVRDISLVFLENGKATAPRTIHKDGWEILGCPVNGPAIARRRSRVAVAWFTLAQESSRVNVALSKDGGKNFAAPIRVDEGNPFGRVDLLALPDGSFLVSWMEDEHDLGAIRTRRIFKTGEPEPSILVGSTTNGRSSGFPRMAIRESEVLIAWTSQEEPSRIQIYRGIFSNLGPN